MAAPSNTRVELRVGSAKSLGLYTEVLCNANATTNNTVITCPNLMDKAVDNERFQWASLWRTETEWRLVASTDVPNAKFTVTRAWGNNGTNNVTFGLYGVLNPDEWDVSIDDAMQDKFYLDRVTIPLVAEQREYAVPVGSEWLQAKGQVIRMRWRNVASGATKPVEDEVAVALMKEVNGVVTFIVPSQPAITNTSLIVEARHYYEPATNDAAVYTLPTKLAMAAVKYEALKQIFHKMGPAAKRHFGMGMVVAEKELQEEEARWLQNVVHRDWTAEDEPWGGDVEGAFDWGW